MHKLEIQAPTAKWQVCPVFSNLKSEHLVINAFLIFCCILSLPLPTWKLACKCLKLLGS